MLLPSVNRMLTGAVMPPEVMVLDIETDCATDAAGDGRCMRRWPSAIGLRCRLSTTGNDNQGGDYWRAAQSALSLLLDVLDPDHAEAGVFVANVCLKLLLFDIECLDRVHIGKL